MMNVLMIGETLRGKALAESLGQYGIDIQTLSGMEAVLRLKGHPGAFDVVTKTGTIQAAGIILTEPPAPEAVLIGAGKALDLAQPDLSERLEASDSGIVFLLDYLAETPPYLTAKALKYALSLAGKGKQITFLSRFVRTASMGMEQVYRDARQAGVTFIKYEHIDCSFHEGVFSIEAFDGVFTSRVSTQNLVAAGKESGFESIIGTFRLAKTNGSYVNGNKFFLDSPSTSRKGIFYLHPALPETRAMAAHIASELRALTETPVSYGEIEAEKCAFCYSCHRVCPHGALEPDIEHEAMQCIETACFACGACAAICPGQAISMKGESASLGDGGHRKVFCCENLGLDMERIPCGGRIGQDWIAQALAAYDEVLVAVCADEACRHMVGGKRGCQLAEAILKLHIPDKKIACIKASHALKHDLSEFLQEGVGLT